MKNIYLYTFRYLSLIFALGLLTRFSAQAQRIDSLMTKADVIIPLSAAQNVNGFLYYLADDGKTGYELWRTDGTTVGTKLVKDIRPGKASAFISDSTFYYYTNYNSSAGRYDIDATKLKNSLRSFRPYVLNNILYFWADDGVNGVELWQSDGTEAGTRIAVDLVPGPISAGNQYDILVSNGGYLGGVNGGYTNASYWSSRFMANQNKLIFWSNLVNNVAWETDGTAAGTRVLNYEAVKYRANNLNQIALANGQLFMTSSVYDKSRSYYSLLQDAGSSTPTTLLSNVNEYPTVLGADAKGVVYSTYVADTKQVNYAVTRVDAARKQKLLRQITMARPATGSRSQYAYSLGSSNGQTWILAYDLPSNPIAGKGSYEIWRVDMTTDSVQRVKRYDFTQALTNNQYTYTKGDEQFYTTYDTPTGKLFVSQAADSTGGAFNRYTLSFFDTRTNTFQVLEDNMSSYSIRQLSSDGKRAGTGGKLMIVSRKGTKDAYSLWVTDGQTKQVIKSLSAYEFGPSVLSTDAGLYGVGYVSNYDKDKKLTGYKIDVWKYDSTAAGTLRIGQVNNYPGGVGEVVAKDGALYGINGVILKLTSTPSDSIRRLADIRNYGDINSTLVNNEYVSSILGTINGRQIGKRFSGDNLLVIDPSAAPRQCLILSYPTSASKDRLSNWNSRVIVLAPGKDSLMTLKRQPASSVTYRGDISQIYYHTLQWIRDTTTVLQSGTVDSIRVRQTGIYKLGLKGIADGCVANSNFQIYNDIPKVQILRRSAPFSGGGAYLVANVTGGYPFNINSTTPYYNSVWEYTAADGSVKPISGGQVYAAGGRIELSNVSVKDSDLGTYSLKVTDYATTTAVSTIAVDAATVAFNVDASSLNDRKAGCAGSPISLSASVTGGKAPYTVRWLTAGVPVTGLAGLNPTYTAATSQTTVVNPDYTYYTAEVTDADGRKVLSDDVLIPIYPAPIVTLTASRSIITAGQAVTLTAASTNYQYPTYSWAKDGVVISGVAGRSLTATQSGLYSVTVGSGTTENCRVTLNTTLSAGAGRLPAIESSKPEADLLIMPNPSEGIARFKLTLPKPSAIKGTILNTQGKVIHQWSDSRQLSAVDAEIDLSDWPTGVYIVQIESDGKMYSKKLIKK
ncbi:hypothetical protein GCM10028807_27390 [Spirosoma daeguense]